MRIGIKRRLTVAILASVTILAACGGADEIISLAETSSTTSASTTTTADSTSSSGATPSSSATDSSTTTTTTPPEVTAQVIRLLTVQTTPVNSCAKLVRERGEQVVDGVYSFNGHIGALKGVAPMGPRLWSDAVHTPAKGDTPVEKMEDINFAICTDPFYGMMAFHNFAILRVGDIKVRGLNDWMTDLFRSYRGDVSQLDEVATEFMSLVDVDPDDVSQAQAKDAIEANLRWQAIAAKLIVLNSRFHLVGELPLPSELNIHLKVEEVVQTGLPNAEINPRQENMPALVLELTVKDAPCVPYVRIGYNVGDKRPERFAPPVCVPPTSTTTTPGGCSTNCGGTTTTTRPGSTTTTVGTTTTTTCESGKCVVPTTASTSPPNTGPTTPTTRPTPTTNPPTTVVTAHPPPPTTLAPNPLTCEEREAQGLPLPRECL